MLSNLMRVRIRQIILYSIWKYGGSIYIYSNWCFCKGVQYNQQNTKHDNSNLLFLLSHDAIMMNHESSSVKVSILSVIMCMHVHITCWWRWWDVIIHSRMYFIYCNLNTFYHQTRLCSHSLYYTKVWASVSWNVELKIHFKIFYHLQ